MSACMALTNHTATTRRWTGLREVVAFNWPKYAAALGTAAVALSGAAMVENWLARTLLCAATAVAVWFTAASLVASHWIYDRSAIATGAWLAPLLPRRPRRWAAIHAGFDVYGRVAVEAAGLRNGVMFDIFSEGEMTERSIRRARASAWTAPARSAAPESIPVPNGAYDAVLVVFAAHEIRSPQARLAFFRELRRITRRGASLIVVEHARDFANFAAFGPGFLHFLPAREWRRVAPAAGLVAESETRITPFVRAFVWRNL